MMTPEKREQYDLEEQSSAEGQDASRAASPRPAAIPRSESVEPLPIEDEPEPPKSGSVRELDICPDCGASMRGSDDLVCIRCGFDLKAMTKVRTVTGETTSAKETEEDVDEQREPIIRPGAGGLWLPGAIAALAGLILLIAYLAGVPALFPAIVAHAAEQNVAVQITALDRFAGILKLIVLVMLLVACGIGALVFLSFMQNVNPVKRWEDWPVGLLRMLAIVLTMRLAALISFQPRAVEWTVEAMLQVVVFAAMSLALFRLKPRDIPTLTGAFLLIFVFLWLMAIAVVWATG